MQQLVDGVLKSAVAQQGIPHHRRQPHAGGQRRARAPPFHVDAKLQATQTALIERWELVEILFNQGKTARLEGRRIGFGQARPLVEIEQKTE